MDIPIRRGDGSTVQAHITPENVEPANPGFENAGAYSVWVGTEDAGRFIFSKDKTEWTYEGRLTNEEQSRIATFIQTFKVTGAHPL